MKLNAYLGRVAELLQKPQRVEMSQEYFHNGRGLGHEINVTLEHVMGYKGKDLFAIQAQVRKTGELYTVVPGFIVRQNLPIDGFPIGKSLVEIVRPTQRPAVEDFLAGTRLFQGKVDFWRER